MRPRNYIFIISMALLFGMVSAPVYAGSGQAGETGEADSWQFIFEFYVWGASIGGESATGAGIDIDFSDLLENLDFTYMGTLAARKDKWTFLVDAIYLDVNDNSNSNVGRLLQLSDVGLKAWIVTPAVGYEVFARKRGRINLLAGARYLWIEGDLKFKDRPPLPPATRNVSDSGDVWDAIVGIRGNLNLTEKWYAVAHLDVGTGETDFTWQALAGMGYSFERFDIVAGYRYMAWNFDNNDVFEDLNLSGPMAGVKFRI